MDYTKYGEARFRKQEEPKNGHEEKTRNGRTIEWEWLFAPVRHYRPT
jgi:hypothetical protein